MIYLKTKRKKSGGYTMIELLFSIAVFIMIVLALTLLARNIWVYNTFISASLNNIDMGRKTIKSLTRELRTASASNTGTYTIYSATPTSFIFYSDTDNDTLKERIRYFLNGTTLQKGVTVPTGAPLNYVLANEVINTMVQNVNNATVFEYYDKFYDGTSLPLVPPVNVSDIRLIKFNLTVDKDPNRSPGTRTFSTQVSIRNLKDNF